MRCSVWIANGESGRGGPCHLEVSLIRLKMTLIGMGWIHFELCVSSHHTKQSHQSTHARAEGASDWNEAIKLRWGKAIKVGWPQVPWCPYSIRIGYSRNGKGGHFFSYFYGDNSFSFYCCFNLLMSPNCKIDQGRLCHSSRDPLPRWASH